MTTASPEATLTVTADRIVLAVGTQPAPFPGIGGTTDSLIDGDLILQMKSLPRTLTLVGAG